MAPVDPFAGSTLVVAVLAFLAGATAPTYYAQERMRGFGRWMLGRLPYESPPGQSEEEALQEAQAAADGPEAEDDGQGG